MTLGHCFICEGAFDIVLYPPYLLSWLFLSAGVFTNLLLFLIQKLKEKFLLYVEEII